MNIQLSNNYQFWLSKWKLLNSKIRSSYDLFSEPDIFETLLKGFFTYIISKTDSTSKWSMTIFGFWCTSCVFWPKSAKLQPFSDSSKSMKRTLILKRVNQKPLKNDTQSLKIFKIPDSGKSLTEWSNYFCWVIFAISW